MTHTKEQIKERPILFSGPMVRAILEGRKTQTRRIVKGTALEWLAPGMFTPEFVADPGNRLCPYGQPGDRLWVRETWSNLNADFPAVDPHFVYRADENDHGPVTWKPSIHMPRAASRLLLEVTDVRVERLQDISEDDARAEGVLENPTGDTLHDFWHYAGDGCWGAFNAVHSFESLWQSINGPESWDENPWVWAVTFKRIEP